MITYNHEPFIAHSIDSILMQEVDFEVEVVIGEDCSPDRTRQIVQDYAKRFPGVVRTLLPENNVGMMRNFITTLNTAKGEFIAVLEGDDYWTDKDKLAKQVRFMRENPGCALSHHRVSYMQDGIPVREFPPEARRVNRINPEELAYQNFIQTCSLVFRRSALPVFHSGFAALKMGDWPLCALLAERGWIGYLDSNMAHYRLHPAGTWSSQSKAVRDAALKGMALYLITHLSSARTRLWVMWALPESMRRVQTHTRRGLAGFFEKAFASIGLIVSAFRYGPRVGSKVLMMMCRASPGALKRRFAQRVSPQRA